MLGILFMAFAWLPPFLQVLVRAVLAIAFLILGMRVLKLIWDVIDIFFNFFGGVLSRVVAFFV